MELKGKRQLYASPNGDVWSVGRDDTGRLWVEHAPNKSSGGTTSLLDVSAFLTPRENHGPQHQALLQLLGSEGARLGRMSPALNQLHPTENRLTGEHFDRMEEKAAKTLGTAVVGLWGDLPRAIQEILFEAAVIAGHQGERDEAFREQLAQFLHDRHPRTGGSQMTARDCKR
jgi:hypothetical protein